MIFYGGDIIDIQDSIEYETLDFILDLIDRYIELVEMVEV